MKRGFARTLSLLVIASLLFLAGCGGSTAPQTSAPAPQPSAGKTAQPAAPSGPELDKDQTLRSSSRSRRGRKAAGAVHG